MAGDARDRFQQDGPTCAFPNTVSGAVTFRAMMKSLGKDMQFLKLLSIPRLQQLLE